MFIGNVSDRVFSLSEGHDYDAALQLEQLAVYLNNRFDFVEGDKRAPLELSLQLEKVQRVAKAFFDEYAKNRSVFTKIIDWVVSFFTKSEYEKKQEIINDIARLILQRDQKLTEYRSLLNQLGFTPDTNEDVLYYIEKLTEEIKSAKTAKAYNSDSIKDFILEARKNPVESFKEFVRLNLPTLQKVVLLDPNFKPERREIIPQLDAVYWTHRQIFENLKLFPDFALNDIEDNNDSNSWVPQAQKLGFKEENPEQARRILVAIKHSLQGEKRNTLRPDLKHSELLTFLRSKNNDEKINFINNWTAKSDKGELVYITHFIEFLLLDPKLIISKPFDHPFIATIAQGLCLNKKYAEHKERLLPALTPDLLNQIESL